MSARPDRGAPVTRVASWLRRARIAWRGSLRLRVLAMTGVIGLAALGLVSGYLSEGVRDTLYDQRLAEVLADAATRTAQVQQQFDVATVTTPAQVQEVTVAILRAAQSPGSGNIGTLLRQSPAGVPSASPVNLTVGSTVELSTALRTAVQTSLTQHWQPVEVTTPEGNGPGIVVGGVVNPPEVGLHELYFVYSLVPEQQTLTLLQQTLTLAALALLALLAVMGLYLIRQVLGPVQQAARTAGRLADGHLEVRMTEKGHDELARLGRSFNEMADSLQDQIERLAGLSHVQQQFVSDVSHELRTPLTTIRMATEILYDNRGEFDPVTRRSAELLHMQVDRFESLLGDLLEISRFDAGAAVLDAEHLDVRTVARRAVELAAPLAERMGTALELEVPETECRCDLDPRRVERILRNLLANAIEHAEGRGIEVVVAQDDHAVSVSVVDHGVGMTARQCEQVFDRFWRGDPSRKRTIGGTGLGLAISLEDARLHGGTLDAWGRPGVGSTFRLTLPRRAGVVLDGSPGPLERVHDESEPPRAIPGPSPAALPGLEEE